MVVEQKRTPTMRFMLPLKMRFTDLHFKTEPLPILLAFLFEMNKEN